MASLDLDQCIGLSALTITSLIAGYFTDTIKNVGRLLAAPHAGWRSRVAIWVAGIGLTVLGLLPTVGLWFMAQAIIAHGVDGWQVRVITASVNIALGFLITSVLGAVPVARAAAEQDLSVEKREREKFEIQYMRVSGHVIPQV